MNNKELVIKIIKKLERADIHTILFGGWAKEFAGTIEPRNHKDIDLLYIGKDFSKVDDFITNTTEVDEFIEKRFAHKRAFLMNGVMIEIMLVQVQNNHFVTNFWNSYLLKWPMIGFQNIVFQNNQIIKVVNSNVIDFYQRQYEIIQMFRDNPLNERTEAA